MKCKNENERNENDGQHDHECECAQVRCDWPLLCTNVNDNNTRGRRKEAFAIAQILSRKKITPHSRSVLGFYNPQSTWLFFFRFFLYKNFFRSFLVQFLRFHSSDGAAYAVLFFLSSFCAISASLFGPVALPMCVRSLDGWIYINAIVQSWCEYKIVENRNGVAHTQQTVARAKEHSYRNASETGANVSGNVNLGSRTVHRPNGWFVRFDKYIDYSLGFSSENVFINESRARERARSMWEANSRKWIRFEFVERMLVGIVNHERF